MSSTSPPKPWERAGGGGAATTTMPTSNATASSTSQPTIPEKPNSLSEVATRNASTYTGANSAFNRPYGTTGFGSSPYGSSPYSSFNSPYSRFGGGYGSGMYGGGMYGGGMYGGGMYGGGMYGGGPGMYGGMGGPGQNPNDSLTNNFQQSTQATFQIIESIVGAFGGFAQMLESTYMATHSSFFAMVSVAEQFGNLRQTLGSVLGIYAVLRWARTLFAKITGRPPPADATALTPAAFFAFSGTQPPPGTIGADGKPVPPRPSKKPFIVFLLAVFGLPYLMGKLIRALAKSQEEAQAAQLSQQGGQNGIDASKLDFCRALFDYPPADQAANVGPGELVIKKGDLLAVLDKDLPDGQPQRPGEEWWLCRARDARIGYLPRVFLEPIHRKPVAQQISDRPANSSGPNSRANTMPASVYAPGISKADGSGTQSRAQTLSSVAPGLPHGHGRAETMKSSVSFGGAKGKDSPPVGKGSYAKGVEEFQKAWINER